MARLTLSLLGGFQVELDGRPVTEFKSRKVRALLAYLAVEAGRPRRHEPRWWELRATVSLCQLIKAWSEAQDAGRAEARGMLAEIYDWFDEGFDMQDLREARKLLQELGAA